MSSTKAALRERIKHIRASLSPGERQRQSSRIHDLLLGELDGENPVMIYVSKPPEVITTGIIDSLLRRGTGVVVPIIQTADCSLRLSYLRDLSALSVSTFSVPEPIGNEIPASPESIGVVVVPMIAYDRSGHRLGYGAGYYDRFLSSSCNMKKIGIAFSCQEIDHVPADENDVRMDVIITEEGVLNV
jgi:5,10-methenyltetrahydrofolate synthetase